MDVRPQPALDLPLWNRVDLRDHQIGEALLDPIEPLQPRHVLLDTVAGRVTSS